MSFPTVPLSIIIPVWNEAAHIVAVLSSLQTSCDLDHEVIVVDGGSHDATTELALSLANRVIIVPHGRAAQMNAGARLARGEILLFLHADTRLPERADQLIMQGLASTKTGWGRFDVRLSGAQPLLRVVERLMNWRSRLSGIATGDQAIFVRHEWFETAGGYPDIALMEDIALSRRLKRRAPPLCLREQVITSSRRWEQQGVLRTIVLMWGLRLAYALGADPARLARLYNKS